MPEERFQPRPDGFAPGSPPTPKDQRAEPHIILNPPQRPPMVKKPAAPQPPKPKGPPEVKDGVREVVETVVFVVVLVLLLKTFLAEAFVIPTGSMATTLLGYYKEKTCEKCGYRVRVNASEEAERGPDFAPKDCVCPNCHYRNEFPKRGQAPFHGGGP
ncbi:MAG: hypothetical protein HY040_12960 [Planctomycetes bacterium]|nr:hypothetical protein [Planctomycetota bacterium]